MHLMRVLARLSNMMRYRDEINKEVSASSVGWHIDHSLKVVNSICETLAKSDPEKYMADENKSRDYVLGKGEIKRGVAESPPHVVPPPIIEPDELIAQLEKAKKNIVLLKQLHPQSYFRHHVLGTFSRDEAKKFITIHSKHHLNIINDILMQK